MNLDEGRRDGSRKGRDSDAELDALVAREVDALAGREARKPTAKHRSRPDEAARRAAAEAMGEDADADGEEMEFAAEPAAPDAPENNVIGMRRGKAPRGEIPFSAEEEAFIEQSVAYLKDRENADLVLEEIWSHAITERQQAMDEMIADEIDAGEADDRDDGGEAGAPADERAEPPAAGGATAAPRRQSARFAETTRPPAKDSPPDAPGPDGTGRR